jgi:hypothetical protein
VKGRSGKSKSLFTSAKGSEVFGRLGRNIGAELKGDASSILATNLHVKIHYK